MPTRLSMIPYQAYDITTFKATARLANKIVVSTKLEYKDAIEFGINRKKIEIIPMGIDIHDYQNECVDKVKDSIELLFVGRIARNRNLETLIQALARLDRNFKLKIVGEEARTSSTTRHGYLNDLYKLIVKLDLKNRVEFTGQKIGEELRQCYKNADLFVFTSLYESFGQPLLEAAAAGLPIISTPVGVANELVFDNQTGFLVDLASTEARGDSAAKEIANKIVLLKEKNARDEFGKNIQKLVKAHFSWDAIIEKYHTLYFDLSKIV